MASMKIPHNITPIDIVIAIEQQRCNQRLSRMILEIALARTEVVERIMNAIADGMPPLEEVDE